MATKAFIEREGKILVLREGDYDEGTNEGKWQIPGGRMEPGEKYEEALKREVKEETGLEVEVGDPVTMGEWRPEIKGEKWQIVAVFFHCVNPEGEVELSEEHSDYRWIDPEDFDLEFIGNVPEKIEKFAGYGTSDLPKLVRDKVPEKIEEDGKTPFTDSSVDIEEFLLDKIVEEAKELRASRSLGELADLLEVMEAFKSEKGIKDSEVENARKEKQEEKGGFSEGLVLRDVDE